MMIPQPYHAGQRWPTRKYLRCAQQFCRRVAEGATLFQLGREFDISHTTARQWIAKEGLAYCSDRRGSSWPTMLYLCRKEQFLRMVREGMSTPKIAQRLGVARSTVQDWLAREGLQNGYPARRRRERNQAIRLRKEGLTILEIATELNVSESVVSRWLNGHVPRWCRDESDSIS